MNVDITPFINYGALGLICAWFMFKMTPAFERVEAALDRNTRSQMLFLSQASSVIPGVREQAKELLAETEAAIAEASKEKR